LLQADAVDRCSVAAVACLLQADALDRCGMIETSPHMPTSDV
jgi:hypothetical protein